MTTARLQINASGKNIYRIALWLCMITLTLVILEPATAQTVQPTAAQRRMIDQLPPAQRQQALDALRQLQSSQQQSPTGSTGTSEDASPQQRTVPAAGKGAGLDRAEELRAEGGTSLVITLTPKFDLSPDKIAEIDDDPALSRIRGSHYYELDESGVLLLPGLTDVPLLGLTSESIGARLGAEPALSKFNVTVSILRTESIGRAALEPFGYDLFAPEAELDAGAGFPTVKDKGFDPVISGPVPPDYSLGPGDVVRVQLFGNVNASYELEVSRDGSLHLPELGPINVGGFSFAEFRTEISKQVQQKLIGTQASVSLGALRTIRVFALGDVSEPGSYVVSSLATISSALYRSGGISDVGTLRDIQLKRQGRIITRLDLYDLLLNGDTSDDAQLQQGDVIFVPPVGATIGIGGAVNRPAIYEADGDITLQQALALAGGLSSAAFAEGSTLERIRDDRERSVLNVNLARDSDGSMLVQNGDVLMVPKVLDDLTRSVVLQGHVQRPGPREWRSDMRLTDLIPTLSELKPGADANYLLIRRESMPDRRITTVSADLAAAIAKPSSASNIQLMARDKVHVFDLAFGRQRIIQPILEELRLHADVDSPYRAVWVAGTVRSPGLYPLEQGMRISDLVRAGGNLAEGAYTDEAELTRFTVANGERREKSVIKIDLNAALHGDMSEDLELSSYDHLRVSRVPDWNSEWSVSLEGEVRFPGEYQILRGESLRNLIERAGGLTGQAFPEGAIFLREDLKEREAEQLEILERRIESDLASMSLESLESGGAEALSVGQSLLDQLRETEPVGRLVINLEQVLAAEPNQPSDLNVELKDGDRLLVPGRSQEVTIIGEAQYPSSHLYKENLTRDDYISFSGGLTRKADKRLIYVVRANGAVVSANRSRWFSRAGGTEIRPGDTIVIPVETDRIRPLTFWTNVSQIFYQSAIAIAAIRTFNN